MLHYDPQLRQRLLATTDEGVVMNEYFLPFQALIEKCLRNETKKIFAELKESDPDITYEQFSKYQYGEYAQLYAACREHAATYNQPVTAPKVVVLTHPLYLHLTHMHLLPRSEQADIYWNRVSRLFSLEREDLQVAVLTTAHHYAAASSLLLETGQVQEVYLTQFNRGFWVEPGYYDLADKRLFIGGAYNFACLSHSLSNLAKTVNSLTQIWALPEVILESPKETTEILDPKDINWCRVKRPFPKSRITTLDRLLGR